MDPSVDDRIASFVNTLPFLTAEHLKDDINDSCPICLVSFESLLNEQSDLNEQERGVTKLDCGPISHTFCRKDLLEWIRNLHGSCPTCRYEFLDIHPPGSDDESSDGGEYIPNDDDEDDDFLDTSDGFTDTDFDMEVDPEEEMWERSDGEEMHINEESEPSSEGDSMEYQDEDVAVEVNVSVVEGDDSSDEAEAEVEEPK
ncbi:RING-type domain-containing protein [Favolaschia claudopus]|uniref:RING-type domain-containing protein n=1 Tax=Favolaschia claudopus TaxID=2862362 RepID=A0AAW0EDR7_9AGAR